MVEEDRELFRLRVIRARNTRPEVRSAEDWFYYNEYLKQVNNYAKKVKEKYNS